MRFDELRLGESIVRAVTAAGYERPTPIQVQAVPPVLDGRDVLGCAQTGTGKTAAFAMPILQRLADSFAEGAVEHASRPQGRRSAGRGQGGGRGRGRTSADTARRKGPRDGRAPRALVLCPTRELATQIHESFETYGAFLPLDHAVIFGGVSQFHQVEALRAGVDVLVATPGRLQDLMKQGHVDLSGIETLVLDEADQMLDMGFIHDIRRIVKETPDDRQTLFFSATMPPEIRQLADAILTDPISIETTPVATPATAITQTVFMVNRPQKPALLIDLLNAGDMHRTLVFTRTKYGADKLVKLLVRAGIEAAAIHGNKSQGQRTKALDGFKAGRTPVLVATDIAARGIDVDAVTHVVNFDIPTVPETYVHRIGRTARGGASGAAIALCDPTERSSLKAIERLTGLSPRRMDATDTPRRTAAPATTPAATTKRPTPRQATPSADAPRSRTPKTRTPRTSETTAKTKATTNEPAVEKTADRPAGRPKGAPRKRIPRRPAASASNGGGTGGGNAPRGGGGGGASRSGGGSNGNGRGNAGGTRRSGGQGGSARGEGSSAGGSQRRGSNRGSGGGSGRPQRTSGGRPAAATGPRHGSRSRTATRSNGSSGRQARRS